RLKPWRKAFLVERARPCWVFGPVLARAFARLVLILRSLVKGSFPLSWHHLDHFELPALDLSHAPAQRFTEDRPTPIDLAQAGVASALGDVNQAFDPLDVVPAVAQSVDQQAFNGQASLAQKFWDQLDSIRLALKVRVRQLFGLLRLRTVQNIIQMPADAIQDAIDLVDCSRFIVRTLARQVGRIFRAIVLKIVASSSVKSFL